jgi:MatE protein
MTSVTERTGKNENQSSTVPPVTESPPTGHRTPTPVPANGPGGETVYVPTGTRLARLWADLKEAARGTRHDYTKGPIGRAIFLLAVPMVLEMVMESVFAVADIFWVSKLGADAVAAVGLTETLESVVYAVSAGLAMGVGALVARRTGAKDHDGAARAAVQAVLLGVVLAAIIGVTGGLLGPRLLALTGASPSVQAVGAATRASCWPAASRSC